MYGCITVHFLTWHPIIDRFMLQKQIKAINKNTVELLNLVVIWPLSLASHITFTAFTHRTTTWVVTNWTQLASLFTHRRLAAREACWKNKYIMFYQLLNPNFGYNCLIFLGLICIYSKGRIQRNLQNEKRTSCFYSIKFAKLLQIHQLPSTRLQPYFRVVCGSKRVDSNQPESGVFSR